MTPLAMEMLIWWHVHTPTATFPAIEYPSQQELVKLFMDDCVIWRVAPDQYTLTPLGEEWLMRALGTPLPSGAVDTRYDEAKVRYRDAVAALSSEPGTVAPADPLRSEAAIRKDAETPAPNPA